MNDWTDGYFTSSTYTYGYYRELNPVYQRFCLLARGFRPPEIGPGSAHCELGFGQGVSINIHAATSPGQYVGTDFNPSHAAQANEMATAAKSGGRFYDDSFEEMLDRSDLPQFDSISLHGIWSWISPENQGHVVEFARRFLKPGGVLYNSYNCFPGWAPASPMRELFVLYDKYAPSGAATFQRVEAALKFTERMLAAHPLYAESVPAVKDVFEKARQRDHDYLAHEYFNRDWICPYFTDVVEILQPAKLDFACTAFLMDFMDKLNLSQEAIDFLGTIENPVMREQARDYFVNRQFRKDYFVRGLRPLPAGERTQKLLETRYVLTTTEDISSSFKVMAGDAAFPDEIYQPVVEYLRSQDYAPKDFQDFGAVHPEVSPENVVKTLITLVSRNLVAPCQDVAAEKAAKPRCDALNAFFCERAKSAGEIPYLASPLTGGAVEIGPHEQLFLAVYRQKKRNAAALAQAVWDVFSRRGQKLVTPDRGKLETPEENIAELTKLAGDFLQKNLPVLKMTHIF